MGAPREVVEIQNWLLIALGGKLFPSHVGTADNMDSDDVSHYPGRALNWN